MNTGQKEISPLLNQKRDQEEKESLVVKGPTIEVTKTVEISSASTTNEQVDVLMQKFFSHSLRKLSFVLLSLTMYSFPSTLTTFLNFVPGENLRRHYDRSIYR